MTGTNVPESGTEGFIVSGLLTDAGQSEPRYFAIGQSIAIVLDPAKLPAMIAGADALLNREVRLTLTAKD